MDLVVDDEAGVADRRSAGVEVDVCPLQAADLAAAHPGLQRRSRARAYVRPGRRCHPRRCHSHRTSRPGAFRTPTGTASRQRVIRRRLSSAEDRARFDGEHAGAFEIDEDAGIVERGRWHSAGLTWDGDVLALGWSRAAARPADADINSSLFFHEPTPANELGRWTLPGP